MTSPFLCPWSLLLKHSLLLLNRSVWLCEPMVCSTPGFPVLHHPPEFSQTHVHWICDAIQLSHPFSSCLQSFPASGSFPVSRLFASGGQSIGASAEAFFPNLLIHPINALKIHPYPQPQCLLHNFTLRLSRAPLPLHYNIVKSLTLIPFSIFWRKPMVHNNPYLTKL